MHYLARKLAPYAKIDLDKTKSTKDYEILTIDISKPGMKYMTVSCLYRPPTGSLKKCCDFLKDIFQNSKRELWIMGDFNVDYLDRTNDNRTRFTNIFKTLGLKQVIMKFTRPNNKGGTCLDWIVTNSDFVKFSGTLDVLISDHLPVYCVRKKAREKHVYVHRVVRDMSNFDVNNFKNLLRAANWNDFLTMDDPETMWNMLYKRMTDILTIMCPFKKFRQREKVTPWITADIYRAMHVRDKYIRLFRATGYSCYLEWARIYRNKVNRMIVNAKATFIKSKLRENTRNPKKFWRIINSLIKPDSGGDVEMRFYDIVKGEYVNKGCEADFLNNYFVNIVQNLGIRKSDVEFVDVSNIDDRFCFMTDMPTTDEIIKLIRDVDVSKSSCVEYINTSIRKKAMLSIPESICHLFCTSLRTGIIPVDWTRGVITVIPKGGDLSNPSNWRPITQTSVFAKLIQKLVHTRLLQYFMTNDYYI